MKTLVLSLLGLLSLTSSVYVPRRTRSLSRSRVRTKSIDGVTFSEEEPETPVAIIPSHYQTFGAGIRMTGQSKYAAPKTLGRTRSNTLPFMAHSALKSQLMADLYEEEYTRESIGAGLYHLSGLLGLGEADYKVTKNFTDSDVRHD